MLPGGPKSLMRHVTDRPGHDHRYAIDADMMVTHQGWEPSVTFKQGIAGTIDWHLGGQKWLANVVSGEYQNKSFAEWGLGLYSSRKSFV